MPPHRPFFSHALVSVSRPRSLFFFWPSGPRMERERDGPRGPAWIASRFMIQMSSAKLEPSMAAKLKLVTCQASKVKLGEA